MEYSFSIETGSELLGVKTTQSFTLSEMWNAEESASKTTTETEEYEMTCRAEPMTNTTCTMMQYKGYFNVGYTIFWKNYPETRGFYEASGTIVDIVYT